MTTETVTTKRSIRERIKGLRAAAGAVPPAVQANLDTLSLQLLASLGPRTVFCYLSTPGEVSTVDLIDALLASGCDIAVPAVVDRTTMLASRFPGWAALVPGRLGIPAPPTAVPCARPVDCVLVPGLAFSLRGARLGFGAGYYDRWLAAHPGAIRIGLCFEYQLDASTPAEAHDEPLDYLVTERRIVALPARDTCRNA